MNLVKSSLSDFGYKNIEVISDVGSRLNDKRKGLMRVMSLAANKEIGVVGITHKDRLTRFGFNYLETYFKTRGVKIMILNDRKKRQKPSRRIDRRFNEYNRLFFRKVIRPKKQ